MFGELVETIRAEVDEGRSRGSASWRKSYKKATASSVRQAGKIAAKQAMLDPGETPDVKPMPPRRLR